MKIAKKCMYPIMTGLKLHQLAVAHHTRIPKETFKKKTGPTVDSRTPKQPPGKETF